MSNQIQNRFHSALMIVAAVPMLGGCMKTTKAVYSDKDVSVRLKDTVNFVNVHASHGSFEMTVRGAKYSEVRGWIPFYIPIPAKDSILFVTGRDYDNGQATVHVVNLRTGTEIHFPAYDSSIGSNIRNTNNADIFERVEKVNGDKIVVEAGASTVRFRYFVDLQKPEFEKEEGFYTDRTNTWIFPNGKNPNNR